VDIKGNIGVVVEIVKNSMKVRSADGKTMSYNFNALRKLYGPPIAPTVAEVQQTPVTLPSPVPPKKRNIIMTPNFNSPLVPIEELVQSTDFPTCAFGRFVDLHGYTGVVVEVVGPSLKVRSSEGSTSSYNTEALRKIYGVGSRVQA
jgi:hypothetical protein